MAAAHRSLGYLTSPVTSPQDDSVRAAWRSSSAAALTDIPDSPTPSPERPSPRRMHTAPEILKVSPPTPIFSTRKRSREPLQTATRLQSAMLDDDDESIGAARGVLRTPLTSPVKGKTLGSPMVSPPSRKRRYDQEDGEGHTSPPRLGSSRQPVAPSRQPLTSSLPRSTPPHISPSPAQTGVATIRCIPSRLYPIRSQRPEIPIVGRKRSKPLSLRSRMRLALRFAEQARARMAVAA